jgi:homoserine kinase
MHIAVAAPASCANLGPGFDVFGIALEKPEDLLVIDALESKQFRLEMDVLGNVPKENDKNAAAYVISEVARKYGIRKRLRVKLTKGVPVGVGLGSSAASSVAAVFAMNKLFDLRMEVREMLLFASEGEKLCSGAAHLDNITASLMGGFTISPSRFSDPVSLKTPENMGLCIVTPKVELPERKTEYARKLLPESVKLPDFVSNIRNASLIVAGIALSDVEMIGRGMEDYVVERARIKMNPKYASVREEAKKAGASGVCISGAGPSILAVVDIRKKDPKKVLERIIRYYENNGINAEGFITRPGSGARVVE